MFCFIGYIQYIFFFHSFLSFLQFYLTDIDFKSYILKKIPRKLQRIINNKLFNFTTALLISIKESNLLDPLMSHVNV